MTTELLPGGGGRNAFDLLAAALSSIGAEGGAATFGACDIVTLRPPAPALAVEANAPSVRPMPPLTLLRKLLSTLRERTCWGRVLRCCDSR